MNNLLFINQGTTILEANSSDIDFPSQNPTAVIDWKTNDQASDITLDQIKILTRNQRVNVKGVLTLGELPPKEVNKRNGEIGHIKEDCVIEDGKGTSTIHIWDDLMKTLKNGKSFHFKNLSVKNYSASAATVGYLLVLLSAVVTDGIRCLPDMSLALITGTLSLNNKIFLTYLSYRSIKMSAWNIILKSLQTLGFGDIQPKSGKGRESLCFRKRKCTEMSEEA